MKRLLKHPKTGMLLYKEAGGPELIKDVDEASHTITGYAAVFGNWDSDNENIQHGAFTKTLEARGPTGKDQIKFLEQHNPARLIGRPKVLQQDDFGLYHESLVSKTSIGKDAIRLVLDGVYKEQSIGYNVIQSKKDHEDDKRWYLTELKLYEYSLVPWGANELTYIIDAKDEMDADEADMRIKQMYDYVNDVEKALREGTWETDEVPAMVELMAKQLRVALESLSDYFVKSRLEVVNRQDDIPNTQDSTEDATKPVEDHSEASGEKADVPDSQDALRPDEIVHLVRQKVKSVFNSQDEDAVELDKFMSQLRKEFQLGGMFNGRHDEGVRRDSN